MISERVAWRPLFAAMFRGTTVPRRVLPRRAIAGPCPGDMCHPIEKQNYFIKPEVDSSLSDVLSEEPSFRMPAGPLLKVQVLD
jgi:hypothetical protein